MQNVVNFVVGDCFTVLQFLCNRPHEVIQQHVMSRYADGKQFPAQNATAACGDHNSTDASHRLRNVKIASCREILCTLTNCTYLAREYRCF